MEHIIKEHGEKADITQLVMKNGQQASRAEREQVVAKLLDLYRTGVSEGNKSDVALIYHKQSVFEDPLHRIEGAESIARYMVGMYENVSEYSMTVHESISHGNVTYLNWDMSFKHPKLNKGREISMNGVSRLVVEHQVLHHRDYFDVGEMFYEHVPLVGSAIRFLKAKVAV